MPTPARRLAAIVSIDIVGYSSWVERDQAAAAAMVARLRDRASTVSAEHGGRIFSTAGDGLMLEFATASDALGAAQILCVWPADQPLRFGVHLGEVTPAEDGDLLGHGVNVAARLQSEAPPGGILVSQIVRDTAATELAGQLTARGRIRLPKMREMVSVFSWTPPDAEPRRRATEPVLAVLAFDNLSRDRDTRFFSDGVSEEILHACARTRGLKVVGSTSSFAFRGRDKPRAAKALKATHVLDGSVRRNGDQVRVTTQLVETEGGLVLWSERYDREVEDAFALQEEIAEEVAKALALALASVRRERAPKLNAAAFDTFLRAREHLKSGVVERIEQAIAMLEQVTRDAPDLARAWSSLAIARVEWLRFARSDRGRIPDEARDAAHRAIGIDSEIGEAYAALACLESEFGRWREKDRYFTRALETEPNNPFILFKHGQFLVSTGRKSEGYALQGRAFELDPLDPTFAAFHGYNVWATASKEDGRAILEGSAARNGDNIFLWYMRLNLAALDGDFDAANRLREEGVKLSPELKDSAIYQSGLMMQNVLQNPTPEAFAILGEQFEAMAAADPSAALDLAVALSVLGQSDPALEIFEQSLENIDAWRFAAMDAVRPHIGHETALLFLEVTISLRLNPRFAKLCTKLGLARYWRETDLWPDCVTELAPIYDFKAACLS